MKLIPLWLTAFAFVLLPSGPAEGALITYTSRAAFNLAAPGLAVEDFEEANMASADYQVAFPDPLNSASNNLYFQPGDILDGLSLSTPTNHGGIDMFLASAGIAGFQSDVVGANVYVDTLNLSFSNATAVGFDLFAYDVYGTGSDVTVSVFGGADVLLGSFSVFAPGSGAGTFFGVTNDLGLITRINLRSVEPRAEVVDNVAFGTSTPVPEPASMLLLGTGLAAAGVRRWRRKRA